MADPKTPAPEDEAATPGDVSAVAGAALAGVGTLMQGAGVIEAAQVMSQTLELNQMMNQMQSELHEMRMQVIDNLEASADLQVIEGGAIPEQAFAAGEGGAVAPLDTDGFDGGFDDAADG